jgi:hypothetical protein
MIRTPLLTILCLLILAGGLLAREEEPAAPRAVKDVLKDLKDRDRTVRLEASEEARGFQDATVTAQLVRMIKDKDLEVRLTVMDVLRDREDRKCRNLAARALSSRLPALGSKVDHEEEYVLAISVLHDLAQPCAVKLLMDFDIEESQETSKARLMAVGNTPCAAAIDSLITFLSKGRQRGRNQQRQACVAALKYATGQSYGNDPDKWRDWWHDVKANWDFQRAADIREEDRQKAEAKRRRAEEKRAKAAEKRRKREEKRRAGEGEDK